MKIDYWQYVSLIIQAQIDISEEKFDKDEEPDASSKDSGSSSQFHNTVLGAKQRPLSFLAIQSTHSEDPAFWKFQDQFCQFLSIVHLGKKVLEYRSIFTQDTTVSSFLH